MTEVTSGIAAPNAPAAISFLGAGSQGGGGLFGGTAGKILMANGWKVSALRPCLDGPANPEQPHLAVNGHYGDGNIINVNATLMRDEWIQFDRAVQQVARERLVVTQALLGRGLRYELPNALGTMTLDWQQMVGDLVAAEITMSGLPEATKDQLGFAEVNMPIPIIHKEWFYNLRHLEAARRNGRNVETTHAQEATRKVAEKVEDLMFTGLTIAGGNIYGMTTHPLRKTLSVTASWTTATGPQIYDDVRRMIDTASASPNFMEGPYFLFVARAHQLNMGKDYYTTPPNTDSVLSRVERIPGIERVIFTTRLTTGAVLVQLTSDVIDIIDGLAPTMVEWDSHGGFQHNFKIFAIQLPRVRANGDSQSGIVHIS